MAHLLGPRRAILHPAKKVHVPKHLCKRQMNGFLSRSSGGPQGFALQG
jgi:hypothetical protein